MTTLMTILQTASSESGSSAWWLLLGPAGGWFTYTAIYRYYRNQDKSHAFETETLIEAQPVQGGVVKVDHIDKTKRSRIKGDNSTDHRARVHRLR